MRALRRTSVRLCLGAQASSPAYLLLRVEELSENLHLTVTRLAPCNSPISQGPGLRMHFGKVDNPGAIRQGDLPRQLYHPQTSGAGQPGSIVGAILGFGRWLGCPPAPRLRRDGRSGLRRLIEITLPLRPPPPGTWRFTSSLPRSPYLWYDSVGPSGRTRHPPRWTAASLWKDNCRQPP